MPMYDHEGDGARMSKAKVCGLARTHTHTYTHVHTHTHTKSRHDAKKKCFDIQELFVLVEPASVVHPSILEHNVENR